jgi:hypothetical protein
MEDNRGIGEVELMNTTFGYLSLFEYEKQKIFS